MDTPLGRAARRRLVRSLLRDLAEQRTQDELVQARPPGALIPLTSEQRWLLTALTAVPEIARLATVLRLDVPVRLDTDRLWTALHRVAATHDALHLVVRERYGTPVLLPGDALPDVRTLRLADGADVEAAVQDGVAALGAEPFDLAEGPLLRAALIEHGARSTLLVHASRMVFDRQSCGPFARGLLAAYEGREEARSPVGFGDYAFWSQHRTSPEQLRERAAQAVDALGPALPSRLPVDRARPAGPLPSTAGAAWRRLQRPALDALADLGGAQAVLIGALAATLHRFGCGDPVRIGVIDDGRGVPAAGRMIGQLTTTVATSFAASRPCTVHALIGAAAEGLADHPPVPFAALLRELDLAETPTEPLLPVGVEVVELPDLRLESAPAALRLLPSPLALFDLSVVFVLRRKQLDVLCEYSDLLFDASTVERILHGLERLLGAASAHPDAQIADLPVSDTVEAVTHVPGSGLGQRAGPVSIWSAGRTLAGKQIAEQIAVDGAWLASEGVGPGTILALQAGGERAIPALLAALRTGADLLVLDPDDPPLWREQVLHAADPHLVAVAGPEVELCRHHGAARSGPDPSAGALLVPLDPASGLLARVPVADLRTAAAALARLWALDSGDRLLHSSSLAAEDGVVQLLAAEAVGTTLVLAPAQPDPAALFDILSEAEVTVAELPDAVWSAIPAHLLSLRSAVRRATESTTGAAGRWWLAEAPQALLAGDGRLRLADPAATARVLDQDGCLLPPGCIGELWLGVSPGAAFARAPRATAARFQPDPVGPPGARLVGTGALARLDADGALELLDVPPDRVVGGGRSLLLPVLRRSAESEDGVTAFAGVHPLAWGEPERPFMVVAPAGRPTVDVEAVRARLADALPAALVPQRILPLAAGGQLDEAACRRLAERAVRTDEREYEPPATATERRLATAVLMPLLEVARFGRRDTVFELGGSSLHVIQALARIRALYGVEIPLAAVFVEPSLLRLAQLVDEAAAAAHEREQTIAAVLDQVEALPEDALEQPTTGDKSSEDTW